jgi:hypothetical protein
MKTRRKLLAGFEVEWCFALPIIEGTNDCDPGNARYARADFAEKSKALAFAKKMLPQDCFGAVQVTEFEMRQFEVGIPAYYREYIGDPIEVSGR